MVLSQTDEARLLALAQRVADMDEVHDCECDEGRFVPRSGEHTIHCEARDILRHVRGEAHRCT